MDEASRDEPRFLADAMLGRLARWLRVLGFDTAHEAAHGPAVTDRELVDRAARERRALLTRDRPLIADLRPKPALLVTADEPLEQLRQVVARFGLRPPPELFTRCLVCNASLRVATPEEAATLVPPRSLGLPGPVRACPDCGRVYWHGSHARRMRSAIERTLPGWGGDQACTA
ncbi:MAG TPA: Mut7-C RNAse domain-containing protein [Planctomycetaceae bacterium]